MTIAESFAAEFRREADTTRKFLERFPDGRADWKPHEKSMSLGKLASHIVDMPNWAPTILDAEAFDFATSDYQVPAWRTKDALLEGHGKTVAGFLAALEGRTDEQLGVTWKLLVGGRVLEAMPRSAAIRSFIVSHGIHHRAQLGVYYRLLGIPVPGAYGPSADDPTP